MPLLLFMIISQLFISIFIGNFSKNYTASATIVVGFSMFEMKIPPSLFSAMLHFDIIAAESYK
jgi:hypothetical protein